MGEFVIIVPSIYCSCSLLSITMSSRPIRYRGKTTSTMSTLNYPASQQGLKFKSVPHHYASTHTYSDEIDIPSLADPIHCFCGLPASKTWTSKFGVQYDCYYYSSIVESNDVCGFHVHEDVWRSLLNAYWNQSVTNKDALHRIIANHADLQCSWFNFTVCAVFRVFNGRRMATAELPVCFCNTPVKLTTNIWYRTSDGWYKPGDPNYGEIIFLCSRHNIGRPMCAWRKTAVEMRFPRGANIHNSISCSEGSIRERHTNLRGTLLAQEYKIFTLQRRLDDLTHKHEQTETSSDKKSGEKLCCICLENPITFAIIPCGHLAYCDKCIVQIHECGICRGGKDNVVKIYLL